MDQGIVTLMSFATPDVFHPRYMGWTRRLIPGGVLLGLLCGPALAQSVRFQEHVIDLDPPAKPYYKLVGDVNGDQRLDLVVAGQKGPLVMYAGPDWDKTVLAEGGYNGGVNGALADLDNDGDLDVVMGGVVWFENPGSQATQSWPVHRIDTEEIHDVEVADVNGDGRLGIVCRDQSAFGKNGNRIFVYTQSAGNAWQKTQFTCPHGEGLKVADLDADGHPEIVIAGLWFSNNGGTWTEHAYGPDWSEPDAKVEVGDINGDSRPDIVVTPSELKGETYRISWFESTAGDKSLPWQEHVIVPTIECVIHSLGLGDFNQDGQLDIAYALMHQGKAPQEVVVLINQDNGRDWERIVLGTAGSHDIVVADLTGDGLPDVAGANHSGEHPLLLWENLGTVVDPTDDALPK